jgi:dephospho-CoA kinase
MMNRKSDKKYIIGLSGEMGSGKGTIAHYLVDRYGFISLRMSDMLRDIVQRLHISETRENISKVSKMVRDTFGQDVMSHVIAEDARTSQESIVVDGIRRREDIEHLRALDNFFLVYIEVDERIRYERLVARGENRGDSSKTFKEFQEEQNMEADRRVKELRDVSKYTLNNNGDITNLYVQMDDIIKKLHV